MRLFLGIALSDEVRSEIAGLIGELKPRLPGVRWTRPENLHVTLHFFGEMDEAALATAAAATASVAQASRPILVQLDRLGDFSHRGQPQILWIGGESEDLQRLAGRCRTQIAHAGFTVDDRPFHAHCTIGRAKGRWDQEVTGWWRQLRRELQLAPATADTLIYFESVSAGNGPQYIPRITQPLSG